MQTLERLQYKTKQINKKSPCLFTKIYITSALSRNHSSKKIVTINIETIGYLMNISVMSVNYLSIHWLGRSLKP